uniref:Coiled-coil domain containing 74B n=1 Tax=Myotis lucifugus TaxID=59463 RepID=G1QGC2_MYOLU
MNTTGAAAGQPPPSSETPSSRSAQRPRHRTSAALHPLGHQAAQLGVGEAQKRVLDLEKSLQFLQQQHSETLVKLHEEIDHLKRENKELHYKLIMNQKSIKRVWGGGVVVPKALSSWGTQRMGYGGLALECPGPGPARPGGGRRRARPLAVQKLLGHPGLNPACSPTGSITNSNFQAVKPIPNSVISQNKARAQPSSKKTDSKTDASQKTDLEEKTSAAALLHSSKLDKAPVAQRPSRDEVETFNPDATWVAGSQHKSKQVMGVPRLMNLPPHLRKPTSLQQCEVVIRQLWNANLLQAQELQHLKSLLERTRKSSRAASEEAAPSSPNDQEAMQLSKVPTKGVSRKCLILSPIPVSERAILPALKQTLKNNFAERQKRLQVVQSRRLHRSVL